MAPAWALVQTLRLLRAGARALPARDGLRDVRVGCVPAFPPLGVARVTRALLAAAVVAYVVWRLWAEANPTDPAREGDPA